MFRAIAYKEWLKIRWAWGVLLLISLAVTGSMVLSLNHDMEFNSPMSVWSAILFLGYQYYGTLRFVPLFIGLVIAAAQFVPEALSGRLTLSLHLPVRENTVVLWMLAAGFLSVLALLVLLEILLWCVGLFYFPREILLIAFLTIAPWMLAGCAGYLALAAVIVEPRWIQRVFLALVAAGLIGMLLRNAGNAAYAPTLLLFFLLVAFTGITTLLSAHRFRRGVR